MENKIIQPIILYNCVAWSYDSGHLLNKFQATQNKILRTITGTNWYTRSVDLHTMMNSRQLQEIYNDSNKMFYEQSDSHTNTIIRSLGRYDPDEHRKHNRPRLA
uniref:Uncharacterized protein n=1 Tax=Timema poppense TaxID=170557 RepID=A0A7R9GX71_TIMPO|nr:unnamed protein product [Timema poppensis]